MTKFRVLNLVTAFAIALGFAWVPNDSIAEPKVLAICGGSEGYAAHTSNGLFASKLGAQLIQKDGFSDSKIGLLMEKKGDKVEFDIAFINRGVTYRDADEGTVQLIKFNPQNQTFLFTSITNKHDNVRTYMFNLDKSSAKHVLWTDSQMGSSPRTRLMVANCD